MAAEISEKPPEKISKMHPTLGAEASINVVYLTDDIVEADHVTFRLRQIAPHIHMDAYPRGALEKLRSEIYDIAIIDCRDSHTDRSSLSKHLNDDRRHADVVVILPDKEDDAAARALKAAADGYIVGRRDIPKQLLTVFRQALDRHQAQLRRRIDLAPPVSAIQFRSKSHAPLALGKHPMRLPSAATSAPSQMQSSELNRRAARRFMVHIPCRIEWHESSHAGVIRDLSQTGAFLEISDLPQVGAEVMIRMNVYKTKLSLSAKVMHHGWFIIGVRNFHGFGAQFINQSDRTLESLKGLLKRYHRLAPSKAVLLH
jgi:DNA-binding NarL/FixJ family response regulator